MMHGIIPIGVHTAFTEDEVAHVVKQANITCIVCSVDLTPKFLSIASKCPSLKSIVEMNEETGTYSQSNELKIVKFEEVLSYGADHLCDFVPLNPEEIVTIIYTS